MSEETGGMRDGSWYTWGVVVISVTCEGVTWLTCVLLPQPKENTSRCTDEAHAVSRDEYIDIDLYFFKKNNVIFFLYMPKYWYFLVTLELPGP